MGADLILAWLVIDKSRKPDFAAGHAAIERLGADQVDVYEEFDEDADSEQGMAAIRRSLTEALSELECGLGSREVEWIDLRGAFVYVTGGMSYGDAPTSLFETITRLRAVSRVLAAVGFEGEP